MRCVTIEESSDPWSLSPFEVQVYEIVGVAEWLRLMIRGVVFVVFEDSTWSVVLDARYYRLG